MKVLLRQNVKRLGQIGDVIDVRPGYARNYLLPTGLAVKPTKVNLKTVELHKQQYLEEMARQREEIEARAAALSGKEVTLAVRANVEGHLYGSVGPAQIVAAMAEEGIFVEPEEVALAEPIRQLDKYDVELDFGHDIKTTIHVWVVPSHEDADEGDDGAAPPPTGEDEAESPQKTQQDE